MRNYLIMLLLAACTGDPAPASTPAPTLAATPIGVRAAPLLGVIASRTSEVISTQVDGRIVRVVATSGQRVHAGDVIAELDPTLYAEKLRGATAAVDAARAELAGANADVAEASRRLVLERKMFEAGATAEESVRVARANVVRASAAAERAAASARAAEASRAAIETQLAHTRLAAPIDGVVSLVKAQPGAVVAPGTPIARVFDPSRLMIRFQVLRERRREIAVGTAVELRIADVTTPLPAHVTSVSADLEPPLDFAVAEADLEPGAALAEVQVGTLGDVRVAE